MSSEKEIKITKCPTAFADGYITLKELPFEEIFPAGTGGYRYPTQFNQFKFGKLDRKKESKEHDNTNQSNINRPT